MNTALLKLMKDKKVLKYIRTLTYLFAIPGFIFGSIVALFIVIFRWGVMVADMIDEYVLSGDWRSKVK